MMVLIDRSTVAHRWAHPTLVAISFAECVVLSGGAPAVLAPAGFYDGIGVLIILLSFVFYVVWYVLIAVRLLRQS